MGVLLPLVLVLTSTSGCGWDFLSLNPFTPPTAPPGPADSMVLKGDRLEPEIPATEVKGSKELAGAHDLYRRGEFAQAEKLFRSIAENKHNSPQVAEEARYYEAECLRRQEQYPKAADTYNKLLNDFHFGMHRDQALEREFEIADYWLEDTREEIRLEKEKREGKRWGLLPVSFIHLEKSKPLLDEEGRAIEKLEQVALNDLNGRRADEALFLLGSVKFYREDYKEADRYFSQLVDYHPRSKYAPQAMEYAIISKHMSTGGSDYDGRKVAEARKYVDQALRNYVQPSDKNAFLERQLAGITQQQAEKDFKIAEFYRRTGHPASAYFYFEIVRRRYPGTPFADRATEAMKELEVLKQKTPEKPGGVTEMLKQFDPRNYLPGLMPPLSNPTSQVVPAGMQASK